MSIGNHILYFYGRFSFHSNYKNQVYSDYAKKSICDLEIKAQGEKKNCHSNTFVDIIIRKIEKVYL